MATRRGARLPLPFVAAALIERPSERGRPPVWRPARLRSWLAAEYARQKAAGQ